MLYPGPVREYLKELANTEDVTVHSIREDRMADRECVLRFLAFYVIPGRTMTPMISMAISDGP